MYSAIYRVALSAAIMTRRSMFALEHFDILGLSALTKRRFSVGGNKWLRAF